MKFKLDVYGIMLYLNITDYKKTTDANMYDEWCGTELIFVRRYISINLVGVRLWKDIL